MSSTSWQTILVETLGGEQHSWSHSHFWDAYLEIFAFIQTIKLLEHCINRNWTCKTGCLRMCFTYQMTAFVVWEVPLTRASVVRTSFVAWAHKVCLDERWKLFWDWFNALRIFNIQLMQFQAIYRQCTNMCPASLLFTTPEVVLTFKRGGKKTSCGKRKCTSVPATRKSS